MMHAATRSSGVRRRRIALLLGLALVLVASATVIIVGTAVLPDASLDPGFSITLLAGLAIYFALGVIVVMRADGHLVGWLFATAASMTAAVFACWTGSGLVPEDVAGWLVLAGSVLFTPALILLLPAVMLVFPTGELPGPRWRTPVTVVVVLSAASMVAVTVVPASLDADSVNPIGRWFAWLPDSAVTVLGVIAGLGSLAILLALILGIAAIATRFRRATGVERAQLKWLLATAIPAAVLVPLSLSDVGSSLPFIDLISVVTLPLVALAIALAILRYRLYDIDRIVSRTVSWAVVTGLLLAVFMGGVLLLQAILSDVTGGETLAVAASTLFAFALFQPLRRRVQQAVDRRFDRAKVDGQQTVEAFATEIRNEVDLGRLRQALALTAEEAVRPAAATVWLRPSVTVTTDPYLP